MTIYPTLIVSLELLEAYAQPAVFGAPNCTPYSRYLKFHCYGLITETAGGKVLMIAGHGKAAAWESCGMGKLRSAPHPSM